MRPHVLPAALLLAAAPAHAQTATPADPPVGARVRVVLPDSLRQRPLLPRAQAVVGVLTRATGDSLYLRVAGAGGDTLRLPRAALRDVAVSRGASRGRSAALQALGWGLVAGAFGAIDPGPRPRPQAGLIAAGGGAAIGAVFGLFNPHEQWRRVGR